MIRTVDQGRSGLRLDKYWALELEETGVSRARISEWIKAGRADVNDRPCRRPSLLVRTGDRLRLSWVPPEERIHPVPGALDIVWQDEHLLVLDKPAGLSVHPAASCNEVTLANQLLAAFPKIEGQDPLRPGIVHRLDKSTSGLMLAALSVECREQLMQDLAERRVSKEYLALVHGRPERDRGQINLPLGRDPDSKTRIRVLPKTGREALTMFEVLFVFPGEAFSLLKVRIITGRTHQIRVHLAHLGHPILGDRTYGPARWAELHRKDPGLARLVSRQMLHSFRLGFRHPLSREELSFSRQVPLDFQRVLVRLQRRPQTVAVSGGPDSGKSFFCRLLAGTRHPVWNWKTVLAGLLEPGGDGLELLARTLGSGFDPGRPESDPMRVIAGGGTGGGKTEIIFETLAPLLEHRMREFISENHGSRLLLLEIPAGLLQRVGRDSFDRVLRLETEAVSKKDGREDGHDLVIINTGSKEDLEKQAEYAARLLTRSRREKTREFVQQMQKTGIVRCPV
ncbi:MAG: RluA family pseudouridine synthase [Desulfohalobiaceae bacterium]|nr:RluA family pseudouridine synthase [Desulfohalobiaceae bacterium]